MGWTDPALVDLLSPFHRWGSLKVLNSQCWAPGTSPASELRAPNPEPSCQSFIPHMYSQVLQKTFLWRNVETNLWITCSKQAMWESGLQKKSNPNSSGRPLPSDSSQSARPTPEPWAPKEDQGARLILRGRSCWWSLALESWGWSWRW